MTTKHTPATPLPHYAYNNDDEGMHIIAEPAGIIVAEHFNSDDDIAYYLHAANAYPKLVEALRGIALRHDDGTLCFDGCRTAGLQEPSPFCARYQAILRDLGED